MLVTVEGVPGAVVGVAGVLVGARAVPRGHKRLLRRNYVVRRHSYILLAGRVVDASGRNEGHDRQVHAVRCRQQVLRAQSWRPCR